MQIYHYTDAPIKVFGAPFFEEKKRLERLPENLRQKFPNLDFLGRRCPGARVGFRTNAKRFTVRIILETMELDYGMSIYAAQAANVQIGSRKNSRMAGLVFPEDYEIMEFEAEFTKSDEMEDVMIYLPRNEIVGDVVITIEDGAQILPPTPYRYEKPILYYGSSITEGGCCANITNAYNALISRWLDTDYYNFGFSGNARGELEMADYLATIDKSILVLDYDYNAPTVEHLAATHEPFFQRIRENEPQLPIIIMSKPDFQPDREEDLKRREIIRRTYEHALEKGDQNVWFIDGESFFAGEDRPLCTVDTCHPNDLGFYKMAKVIAPVIENILTR